MKAQSIGPQRVFNSYKLEVDTQKLYRLGAQIGEGNSLILGNKYNGPLTLFGKVIENSENRNSLNTCFAQFSSSEAKVRGRSREDFSNSFQARRDSDKDFSPRSIDYKSTTPTANMIVVTNIKDSASKSEDSDDFERDEDANLNQITKTDSDNSSDKKKESLDNIHPQKHKTQPHKVIKPDHLMKVPIKEPEIKNIKPALEKYKKEKELRRYRMNSHSPTNDDEHKMILSSSIKKKKVKGFMIRNSKNKQHTNPKQKIQEENKASSSKYCSIQSSKSNKDFEYKRSHSSLERKPIKIYEEHQFEYQSMRKGPYGETYDQLGKSSTTMESITHQKSHSPRDSFPNPVSRFPKRTLTMPTKPVDKLSEQHPIRNRKEFEEAVSCVFEEEIAHKSLGRKSRVNEDILLDNHAFGRPVKKDKVAEKKYESCKLIPAELVRGASDDSSPSMLRSVSTHNLNHRGTLKATVGKNKKKFIIKFVNGKQNIKI